MFGKRKRELERGRRARGEAFYVLDKLLEHEVQVRLGMATADPARFGVVPIVEQLLAICRYEPADVTEVVGLWDEQFEGSRGEDSDDPVATAATAITLAVGFNGVGNLFGFIPPEAPAYDPDLAAEGRARGWRS